MAASKSKPVIITETLLAAVPAGRGQSVKVRDITYERGVRRLDIRRWWIDDHGQDLPTSRGVSLKPDQTGLLRDALDQFDEATKS